jgi:hypothetical protein
MLMEAGASIEAKTKQLRNSARPSILLHKKAVLWFAAC